MSEFKKKFHIPCDCFLPPVPPPQVGPTGPTGATGPTGPTGATGVTGPTGPAATAVAHVRMFLITLDSMNLQHQVLQFQDGL